MRMDTYQCEIGHAPGPSQLGRLAHPKYLYSEHLIILLQVEVSCHAYGSKTPHTDSSLQLARPPWGLAMRRPLG